MRWIAVALLLAGCASQPAPQPQPQAEVKPGKSGPVTAARGLSCDSAIIIEATNEDAGIDMERKWVRDNYPEARWVSQDLTKCGDTPVDVIHLETANGRETRIFFDISKFFGKH
jgi:hypothetical protein